MSEKRVLVEHNESRKQIIVHASAGVPEIIDFIKSSFGFELSESQRLLVQRKDEDRGGMWVDIEEDEEVSDRSFLKVIVSLKEPTAPTAVSLATPVRVNGETAGRVTNVTCLTPGICGFQTEKLTIEMEIFDTSVGKNVISEKAKTFTSCDEELTNYQKEVNAASIELCLTNPALLMGKKGDLMKLAREKVLSDEYVHKKAKGQARRACFLSGSCTSSEDSTVCSKRPKIDGQERQLRIDRLLEQIADIEKRIAYKQRRIDTAATLSNFKDCDELSQEMSDLKSQKHDLNCLLRPLQKKAMKSACYN